MAQMWSMKIVLAQLRIAGRPASLMKSAASFHKSSLYSLVKGFCTSMFYLLRDTDAVVVFVQSP